jgi:hypothetical protein
MLHGTRQLSMTFAMSLEPCYSEMVKYLETCILNIFTFKVGVLFETCVILEVQPKDNNQVNVSSEVFTAVTMKNSVFWDVTPCGSCKNQCFEGTYRLCHQCE